MNSILGRFLLALLVVPTGLLLGQASETNGNVTGTVTDQTGAAVPSAKVTLVDESTGIALNATTNAAGVYLFQNVNIGTYNLSIEKQGFRKTVIAHQTVSTGTNLTLNVSLEVGSTSETVEVKDVAGAELQTESATMGSTLGGDAILQLPTISRDVSSLVFLQPTAAPTFNGAEGNTTSGNIAGNFADQNTFMLDGGNNTSDLDGDNATYVSRNGGGVIPTPAESVEEFRVNTNNETADFSMSGGGQVMVSTKRGTDKFHGSAYDFFQGDWLNSNDWSNNQQGIAKPKAHFNRFGGALGGPIGPKFLGGRTYFYTNYEGQRYPRSGPFTALVPSATLRAGIIQERDANGNIVQYNLATSTACGTTGGQPCDPLGIGLNPVVSKIWNQYEPACNNLNYGDHGLNTCGYNGNLTFPLANDFGVVRVDHDFGSNWRFFSSYRIYKNVNPTTSQVDVGGLLPGDKLGVPAAASTDIQQPRSFVAGITGIISPTLTNDFHFSYLRNDWQWLRAGALPDFGFPGSVEVGGENGPGGGLTPLNVDTQDARARLWIGHDYEYRDNLSKVLGTHLFQFGGDFFHQFWHFDRYDDVGLGLTSLVYDVSSDNVDFTPSFQPMPCSATVTANCLPSGLVNNWNSLYGQVAGLVGASSVVVTRTGSNLTANPPGTPVRSFVTDNTYSMFFNDTWKIKPNFTLTYGLNYQVQLPPTDANGEQDILTDASGNPISAQSYLAARLSAANAGQVYNPTLGFTPIGDVKGLGYPYKPYYGEISPRVSIAWTPPTMGGWLGALLGDKATVVRAGYGRFYSRNLGIDLVSTPVLGDGFLQPVGCVAPTSDGTCTQPSGSTPATAFRIGVNGTPPVGAITQTLTAPVEPGVNTAYADRTFTLDRNFKPANSDSVDFSIQRQFKGNLLLEVGYVGVYSRNLFQGVDLNDAPWMMKLGGQTFANAYDNLYFALSKGQAVTPQPFFQTALSPTSPYCKGYANCTAAVAAQESSNITANNVTNLWSDLDSSYTFGPALISTNQAGLLYDDTSMGYSNYNAGVVSLQKRSQNLNMLANFTWSKALGIIGLNQAYTENNVNDPWNLGVDYGPQFFDRKFTFNLLGSYNLPFGKGQKFDSGNGVINRVIGGWILSPIYSYGSGLPLDVYTGSFQEWGNGFYGNGCDAIPLSGMGYSNTPVFGVNPTGTIGVNGAAANGGSGVNLFGNPAAVYNNFRPNLVGIDGNCGGGGQLRGQPRWNVDLGLTKDTQFTERVGMQISAQAFNVFNHMMWGDPSVNLQNPAGFGVLTGQYNALGLGGNGATGEYTRIIQLGLRIHF